MTALVLRTRGGGFSVRVPMRPVLVGTGLAVVTAALAVVAISTGDYPVSPGEVIDTLLGGVLAGDLVHHRDAAAAARAVRDPWSASPSASSGAMFQSLTTTRSAARTSSASPPARRSARSSSSLVLGGSGLQVSAGALAGGLVTAVLVYGSRSSAASRGYRLILIGIGISALRDGGDRLPPDTRAIEEAVAATVWLVGSLNGRGWDQVRPLAGALVVLVPAALLLSRPLRLLEMGDDTARALGLRVERARGRDRARRGRARRGRDDRRPGRSGSWRSRPRSSRGASSLLPQPPASRPRPSMGAALVLASDIAAQRLMPTQLPVGAMRGTDRRRVLAWLLVAERKRGRG